MSSLPSRFETKYEDRGASCFILEEGRVRLVRGRVDSAAKIHGRSPAEVVPFVASPRNIEIEPAKAACPGTVAREIEAVSVEGQGRRVLLAGGVDRWAEIPRGPPRVVGAGPL